MDEKSPVCRLQQQGEDQIRQLHCPLASVVAKGEQSNSPPKHILKVGDQVAVFGLSVSGPFIEGRGTIVSYAPDRGLDRFYVNFNNERVNRLRFIALDWQADPDRSLALLREFWRSSGSDNPSFEDFFPDTDS
jgi:hypothetical protein